MKLIDLITIVVAVVMVGCVLVALQYYYNSTRNECVADPFKYGSKVMENKYGVPFYGTGVVSVKDGLSIIVSFDSNGTTIG
jgi:hypothetical protein